MHIALKGLPILRNGRNPHQIFCKNEQINKLANDIISEKSAKNHAISTFKMAMMNFDQSLFFKTYNQLLSEKSFREVFYTVFIPLMQEIGFLWQTETISPAHEHFISYLIKQKLLINTEKVQIQEPTRTDKVFVLFLPLNEVHELGLMYLNYEILLKGYQTIYLGESIPTRPTYTQLKSAGLAPVLFHKYKGLLCGYTY